MYHVGEFIHAQREPVESEAFLVVVSGDKDHVLLEDFEPFRFLIRTRVRLFVVKFEVLPFVPPCERFQLLRV